MSDLMAIDILVNPDDATLERARRLNARMRQSLPTGFALDATHQPHITTLQRYVRTADLPRVYDAVAATIAATDLASLGYEAVAVKDMDWGVPGQRLAGILLEPSAGVLDFQCRLVAAVTPFVGSGGTDEAFVLDPGEAILKSTKDWVEHFVPAQIGAGKYMAHITAGFATLDDVKAIEAESFEAFTIRPASIAVYHLGKSGSARTRLKEWPLT
jgi:hypothetical protein